MTVEVGETTLESRVALCCQLLAQNPDQSSVRQVEDTALVTLIAVLEARLMDLVGCCHLEAAVPATLWLTEQRVVISIALVILSSFYFLIHRAIKSSTIILR